MPFRTSGTLDVSIDPSNSYRRYLLPYPSYALPTISVTAEYMQILRAFLFSSAPQASSAPRNRNPSQKCVPPSGSNALPWNFAPHLLLHSMHPNVPSQMSRGGASPLLGFFPECPPPRCLPTLTFPNLNHPPGGANILYDPPPSRTALPEGL